MKIQLESVSFTYPGGVEALRDIDLFIKSGDAVAFIGENGAGKSTLAKQVNGLLKPSYGRVFVGDWQTSNRSVAQMAGRVGFVFQNPDEQLFARSVREEVAFGPRNLGREEYTISEDVEMALKQVGLDRAINRHPYDLPTPERKLLTIAAILAMRTPVVILDEPTMGQDAQGIARIGRIVSDLKAEGRTVITISHDIDFCAEHFPRVIVLSSGRIVADGVPSEVYYQESMLENAGVIPPQIARLSINLGLPSGALTDQEFIQIYKEHR